MSLRIMVLLDVLSRIAETALKQAILRTI